MIELSVLWGILWKSGYLDITVVWHESGNLAKFDIFNLDSFRFVISRCQISHHRQTGFPPSQGKDLSNNGCSKKVRSANRTVTFTKSSATDTKRWLNFVFGNFSLQYKNTFDLFSTIPRAELFWILIATRILNSIVVHSRALKVSHQQT